jgi:hypothetical protein
MMKRLIGMAAFACSILTGHAGAQTADSAAVGRLFAAVAGKWSCEGGFPNGRKLAADLQFTPGVDGRIITFEHVDRAPGAYWQRSTWGYDAKAGRVTSLAMTGSTKDKSSIPAMFTSRAWTESSITLDADTLRTPPFAPNRFTYSVSAAGLKMVWELGRGGVWALGDSLDCKRA